MSRTDLPNFNCIVCGNEIATTDEISYAKKLCIDCENPKYEDPNPNVAHSIDVNGYCNKGCC